MKGNGMTDRDDGAKGAGSGKYSRWEEGWKRFYRDISEKERVDRMVI